MVQLSDFTIAFEMATSSTPRTSAPSYTALTSYIMAAESITLTRGRQSEQAATAPPGRANATLRNTDARFTMGNGSSPYAPLRLRRPCRYRVTYSATTYDLWQGFVDDWGNKRDQLTGVARLSLSDRLARAAKNGLKNAVTDELLADDPYLLYPLGEDSGALAASDVVAAGAGPVLAIAQTGDGGSVSFGTELGLGPDDATGVSFTRVDSTNGKYLGSDRFTSSSMNANAGSMELFVRVLPGAGTSSLASITLVGGAATLTLGTGGTVTAILGISGSAIINGTRDIADGNLHHVAMTWSTVSTTTTVRLYIDGVADGTDTVAYTAGIFDFFRVGGVTYPLEGSASHFALYLTELSAARIAEHAAAITDWAGETTTARFNRLCANAGMPSTFYATSGTTEIPMGSQPTAGKSLRDALNECAIAEGGVLYVSDTGVLTMATSRTRYNTAVGVTLDASKTGQVAPDTEVLTNDQDLINDSSATRYGGPTFRTSDATSIDSYDLHDEAETLHLALDAHALNWTQWRVAQFKDPAQRLNEIPVNVVGYANSGGNVAQLLNADIGTKLRLSVLPTDVSATTPLDLMIEGIKDEIRKNEWIRTFTVSPIGLNDTVWILGTDLLGVGTILGY